MSNDTKDGKESKFTGGVVGYAVTNAAVVFSIIFSGGLTLPFAMCFRERWMARHTIIDGNRLEFYGNPWILFMRKIAWIIFGPMIIAFALALIFLVLPDGDGDIPVVGLAVIPTITAIVFALFMVWLSLRMKKWIVRHTRIQQG